MSLSSNTDATKQHATKAQARTQLDTFPYDSIFTTPEQMQRFELLLLAFFVLKLRKLNEQTAQAVEEAISELDAQQVSFPRKLLQPTIFQPTLTRTSAD